MLSENCSSSSIYNEMNLNEAKISIDEEIRNFEQLWNFEKQFK